jgi:hypothetical protein
MQERELKQDIKALVTDTRLFQERLFMSRIKPDCTYSEASELPATSKR